MEEQLYPCPSCGFLVFGEPSGSYDICPVCSWEDDHVQLAHPTMKGGANGDSLLDYQTDILRKLPPEIREFDKYKRQLDWRPLTEEDYAHNLEYPRTGLEYFRAAGQDSPAYYWSK